MSKKAFYTSDYELNGTPIRALINTLVNIEKECPNAVCSLRQCDGTDFPPFLAVESAIAFNNRNLTGEYPICC